MKILGIDPGYDRLGLALVEKAPRSKEIVVYSDCFQTSSKKTIYERFKEIGEEICRILETFKPDAVSIETLFLANNKTTAMRVSEVRGILIHEAIRRNIPVFEYGPMEIKVAVTGDGSSDKLRMIKMVTMLVKIPEKEIIDDEYDAIAVALTHLARQPSKNVR
jgi:crossover junction endodeoxyribonuclease RuvC